MIVEEMQKAIGAYREVLRLVRRLPKDTRPYYAKYARENFVNYREIDSNDPNALQELLQRTYNHSIWVLKKVHTRAMAIVLLIGALYYLAFDWIGFGICETPTCNFYLFVVFGGPICGGSTEEYMLCLMVHLVYRLFVTISQ
ncbi:LYR motif-containing protein [Capsicum annuum]|uniref:LYR motif-containing protein n=1 Tax=Capsicum annuum TaxID=4072 RepID=A0A2G2Y2G9_CAPAN|nr:LYR motif-containing protein [Capsicum annuum]PHT63900.1 LYR motif-containing protein [Capsicum annuum]